MNDFSTINEICRALGMTMNWYKGSDTAASETAAPAAAAPDTTAQPIGEKP